LNNDFKEIDISQEARGFLSTYRNNVNSDIESTDSEEVTQYYKKEEESSLDKWDTNMEEQLGALAEIQLNNQEHHLDSNSKTKKENYSQEASAMPYY
jgi:hypothetical protein